MSQNSRLRIEITPPGLPARAPVKRALLIALQYPTLPKELQLKNTYGDADSVHKLLTDLFHFKAENITVLKDNGEGVYPSKENILKAMHSLVADTVPGDRLVFHFSGHGGQHPNEGHDTEDDKEDEAIWPADVDVGDGSESQIKNDILDDLLSDILLPPVYKSGGARLVIIFDCCHSGTAADLDHYVDDHRIQQPKKLRPSRRKNALDVNKSGMVQMFSPATANSSAGGSPKDYAHVLSPMSMGDDVTDLEPANVVTCPDTSMIVSWAACGDPQTTGGVPIDGGVFVKVFTNALRQAAKCRDAFTHGELLNMVEEDLFETVYQLLRERAEITHTKPLSRKALKDWQNMPKPQLLGVPNLEEVKNFLIHDMF